jgi:hypothetical protein
MVAILRTVELKTASADPGRSLARIFHAERARAYGLILAIGLCIAASISAVTIVSKLHGPHKQPAGVDFVAFRSAAMMVSRGEAVQVYLPASIEQEERAEAWVGTTGYYPVLYPPSFLMLLLPLSLLSFAAGYMLFVGGSLILFTALLFRELPGRSIVERLVPVLAFSGVLNTVETGQNGLLTASSFAAAMRWLDLRPYLAGVCLGFLLCKPHLALAVPWVLLAGRRWRALAGFVCCGGVMVVASALVLGVPAWIAFVHAAPLARQVIETDPENPRRMASLFAAMRLLGAKPALAYVVQSLGALAVLAVSWRSGRTISGGNAAALMASAGLLLTPYLFDYDLTCAAIPLVWLLLRGTEDGFLPWDRRVMLAAYFLPVALRPVAIAAGIPLAPPILFALFAVVVRRGKSAPLVATVPAYEEARR